MYKVKLTSYRKGLGAISHRQTKGQQCVSLDGRYKFFIDEDVDEPDFWVVHGKGLRQEETCKVAPENTVFLATEPNSVLEYPQKYLDQFGLVFTNQEKTKHRNLHLGPAILPWFVGFTESQGKCEYTLDYDTLKSSDFPKKTKLVSIISSNLAISRGHINRINFVTKVRKHFGPNIDVYGRGFNGFADKWDILSDYKYTISIENSSSDYYWTEKISDCFLAGTFPIYYGCKKIGDYFPDGSFASIDITDPVSAIKTIEDTINSDVYEKSLPKLQECKNLVLDKYNMFEYIVSMCDTLNPNLPKKNVTLKPCVSSANFHNFLNYTFLRSYYKLESKIRNVFVG